MEIKDIVNTLNEKYKGKFIFDSTDTKNEIVGFIDDDTFKIVSTGEILHRVGRNELP